MAALAAGPAPLAGMWGAPDALLVFDAQGGRLQTGCTLIRFAPVGRDANGAFETRAQATQLDAQPPSETADEDKEEAPPPSKPATLSGKVSGGAMDLSLTVEGQAPRSFHLLLGQRGNPPRCI